MSKDRGKFWVRQTDLGRLFEATRLCYLVGSTPSTEGLGSNGDAVHLAANLQRLNSILSNILSVSVVYWRHIESQVGPAPMHQGALTGGHFLPVGEPCFIYYTRPNDLEFADTTALQRHGLIELIDPPPTYSQILIYGGDFFEEWSSRGETVGMYGRTPLLDMVEALEDWLGILGEQLEPPPSLVIAGQPLSEGFLSGAVSSRFTRLLERAYAIGASDELSCEAIAEKCSARVAAKLILLRNGTPHLTPSLPLSATERGKGGEVSAWPYATTTDALLYEFLTAGYITSLEKKYRSTVEKLRLTLEQLSDLQFEYERLLNARSKPLQAGEASTVVVQDKKVAYQQLISRIQEIVAAALPDRATVIIVSRGDNELLNLDGREGWHFPQNKDGIYAGYYPASSAEAITHLEVVRARGGDFLLFPRTAFWWFDHYKDFRQHLEACYQLIWSDESCTIYQLAPRGTGGAAAKKPKDQKEQRVGAEIGKPQPDRNVPDSLAGV